MTPPRTAHALSLHDDRPFFEKALTYGVQHGLISAEKLAAIAADAPKGMVQIARYFGSEHLRPELEKARQRIVNLVSLYLEESSHGDLRQAAQSLAEHSFLSRSKGGSDMLKKLIAMPQNSHFAMHERGGFTDDQIPLLAKWSLKSHAAYRAELARRLPVVQAIEAALWLAQRWGLDADDLEEAGTDAEAVIRTALLLHTVAPQAREWPDAVAFEKMIGALRQKKGPLALAWPQSLPAPLHEAVEKVRRSVQADLPNLRDASQNVRALLQKSAFMGRYFWIEDPLSEVDHYHRSFAHEEPQQPGSKTWQRVTQGQEDEHALLTLFLYLSVGAAKQYIPSDKTTLTEAAATRLVRQIHKTGLHPERASAFIRSHAPSMHQDAWCQLWEHFVEESRKTLCSDLDYQLHDALALLRRECHVGL
ncbi:MAG: hypothetical protein K2Q11_04185 [Burkholderiaceae bacterium]|nr:hypothetical protein [Burkholderiaceae bacterium]